MRRAYGCARFRNGRSRVEVTFENGEKLRQNYNYRTHNQNIAKMADVVIKVKSGKIKSVEEQADPLDADEVDW